MGIASVGCGASCAAPALPSTAPNTGQTAAEDARLNQAIGQNFNQLPGQSPLQAPTQFGPPLGGPGGTYAEDSRLNQVFSTQYNLIPERLLQPIGQDPVADQASVSQLFAAGSRPGLATATVGAALDRLRPYAGQLSAAGVAEFNRAASSDKRFGPDEAAVGLTQLYVQAATRTGKYTQGAGQAISALLKEQTVQRARMADLSLALANYTNATGQTNPAGMAKLKEVSDNTAELSNLGVSLSQVSDRMTAAQAVQVVQAISAYNTSGNFATLRATVAAVASGH